MGRWILITGTETSLSPRCMIRMNVFPTHKHKFYRGDWYVMSVIRSANDNCQRRPTRLFQKMGKRFAILTFIFFYVQVCFIFSSYTITMTLFYACK